MSESRRKILLNYDFFLFECLKSDTHNNPKTESQKVRLHLHQYIVLIRFWNIWFKGRKYYLLNYSSLLIFTRAALVYRVLKKFSLFYYSMCGWAILSLENKYKDCGENHRYFFRAKVYCMDPWNRSGLVSGIH